MYVCDYMCICIQAAIYLDSPRLIGAAGDSAPAPASYAQPFAVPGALDEYEARDNSY